MGWGWAGVIWLYSLVTYFPLDILKFAIRYILSGKAWDNLLENKVCFVIIFLNDAHFNTRIMSSITLVFNLIFFFFFFFFFFCFLSITDCLYYKERLWKRRERSTMGSCTEDPARSSTT